MEAKTIHQEVEFKASPNEIYELLMDPEKHSGFSGAPCDISREIGKKFECYGGHLQLENVELIENKKIVQKWRAKDFPDGYYSTVTFVLEEKDGGTLLKFTHEGVPEGAYEHINTGWKTMYWDKMKEYLSH